MSNWRSALLGDIVEINMGQSPPGESCNNVGNGIPLLNGPTEFTEKFPIPIQYTIEPKKTSKEGDILFCVRGSTTGKMNWSDVSYAIGRGIAAIRHLEGRPYNAYVKGVLEYNLDALLGGATGSTFPNVSRSDLLRIKILLPPIPEQEAIAEVLSSLDDKIDLLNRNNKTLEQMAKTLFRQWFVEEAQADWSIVKIYDVADINPESIPKDYKHSQVEYLDTGSITQGNIYGYQIYNLKDAPSRAQRVVKDNDIVYSLVRPAQRHYGILSNIKPNTIVSTGFCVVRAKRIGPHFLYLLLTQENLVEQFESIAEGSTSTYPSLTPSDIGAFEFPLPPENKILEFTDLASSFWKKIHNNYGQINQLSNLRDTLLPKLMSGEVRVKP